MACVRGAPRFQASPYGAGGNSLKTVVNYAYKLHIAVSYPAARHAGVYFITQIYSQPSCAQFRTHNIELVRVCCIWFMLTLCIPK